MVSDGILKLPLNIFFYFWHPVLACTYTCRFRASVDAAVGMLESTGLASSNSSLLGRRSAGGVFSRSGRLLVLAWIVRRAAALWHFSMQSGFLVFPAQPSADGHQQTAVLFHLTVTKITTVIKLTASRAESVKCNRLASVRVSVPSTCLPWLTTDAARVHFGPTIERTDIFVSSCLYCSHPRVDQWCITQYNKMKSFKDDMQWFLIVKVNCP